METLNNIPTDEQLAAYLSGTCDDAGLQLVEHYLDKTPEAVDDLLNISMAAAVQARRDARRTKVKKIVFRPAVWAAAASVALVLMAGIAILTRPQVPEGIAEARPVEHGLMNENGESDTVNPTKESPQSDDGREVSPEVLSLPVPLQAQHMEKITASKTATATTIEVVSPRREREVIRSGNDVTFTWTSDAPALTFSLTDNENHLLLRADLPNHGTYKVPFAKLEGQSEVIWTITAYDGDVTRTGKIVIMSDF